MEYTHLEKQKEVLIEALKEIIKVPKNHDGIDRVRFIASQALKRIEKVK